MTHSVRTSSPTYKSWGEMKRRCLNPRCKDFVRYGAVGISVCDRWLSYDAFLADMGHRPEGTSLDRIDGTKGYYPSNCRWATPTEQANNTKKVKLHIYKGCLLSVSQIAKAAGISVNALWGRLNRGMAVEDAIAMPYPTGDSSKRDSSKRDSSKRDSSKRHSEPFDWKAYNQKPERKAYNREYMRKWRAAKALSLLAYT
jgi:hypothetical protein